MYISIYDFMYVVSKYVCKCIVRVSTHVLVADSVQNLCIYIKFHEVKYQKNQVF